MQLLLHSLKYCYAHFLSRYGGWTFESDPDNTTAATVWFDNRAFHSSPSYMNALSNMIIRAAMAQMGVNADEYGITVYNHPLMLSPGQLSIQNALEQTADLGISLTFLAAFSFIPAGNLSLYYCERIYLSSIDPVNLFRYVSK